jgi:hypothetical protein
MRSPPSLLTALVVAAAVLSAGCTRERFCASCGYVDGNVSWSKFCRHGNERDARDIALIVYSDYNTVGPLGVSIFGAGCQDRDGLVVTFAITEPNTILIMDKFFDLRNGRFFHVYRQDPKHLAVQQENAISPIIKRIIAI